MDSFLGTPGTPQSLHRYSYTYHNPTRYTDPSGHQAIGADGYPSLSLPAPRPGMDERREAWDVYQCPLTQEGLGPCERAGDGTRPPEIALPEVVIGGGETERRSVAPSQVPAPDPGAGFRKPRLTAETRRGTTVATSGAVGAMPSFPRRFGAQGWGRPEVERPSSTDVASDLGRLLGTQAVAAAGAVVAGTGVSMAVGACVAAGPGCVVAGVLGLGVGAYYGGRYLVDHGGELWEEFTSDPYFAAQVTGGLVSGGGVLASRASALGGAAFRSVSSWSRALLSRIPRPRFVPTGPPLEEIRIICVWWARRRRQPKL